MHFFKRLACIHTHMVWMKSIFLYLIWGSGHDCNWSYWLHQWLEEVLERAKGFAEEVVSRTSFDVLGPNDQWSAPPPLTSTEILICWKPSKTSRLSSLPLSCSIYTVTAVRSNPAHWPPFTTPQLDINQSSTDLFYLYLRQQGVLGTGNLYKIVSVHFKGCFFSIPAVDWSSNNRFLCLVN